MSEEEGSSLEKQTETARNILYGTILNHVDCTNINQNLRDNLENFITETLANDISTEDRLDDIIKTSSNVLIDEGFEVKPLSIYDIEKIRAELRIYNVSFLLEMLENKTELPSNYLIHELEKQLNKTKQAYNQNSPELPIEIFALGQYFALAKRTNKSQDEEKIVNNIQFELKTFMSNFDKLLDNKDILL